jgi:general secretion pathway protein H
MAAIPRRCPAKRAVLPAQLDALSHRGHGPLLLHSARSARHPALAGCEQGRRSEQRGFSLIEIIVVVAIIAVLASAITLSVNAVGAPRMVEREARRIEALVALACERAEISGRDVGVHLGTNSYGFSVFLPAGWRIEGGGALRPRELPKGLALDARRDGIALELAPELPDEPQLVCFASGELTPFALEVTAGPDVQAQRVRGEEDGSLERRLVDEPA